MADDAITDDLRTASMLPGSSSDLEQHLTTYFDPRNEVVPSVSLLRTAKLKEVPDSYVPWLVYEYGLEEVLPWITDPREAMRTGVQWQRIRGTKAALELSLSWVGFTADKIEEEVPGRHFFEYQIGLHGNPPLELIDNIVQLSALSSPIRSRLSRMYNAEYDVRRYVLDSGGFGDLLSADSGMRWGESLLLSFGRLSSAHPAVRELQPVAKGHQRHTDLSLAYRTGLVLGYSEWGAVPILENTWQHARLLGVGDNEGVPTTQLAHIHSTFSKSAMILSDGFALDSLHTQLSGSSYTVITGDEFCLDYHLLDEVVRKLVVVPVDELIDNVTSLSADYQPVATQGSMSLCRQHKMRVQHAPLWPDLDVKYPIVAVSPINLTTERLVGPVNYEGQYWAEVVWPDVTWDSINTITGEFVHVSSSE